MSLVADYGSSSESESENEQHHVITKLQPPPPATLKKKKIILVPATSQPATPITPGVPADRSGARPAPKSSILSFLPAPKNRKQHNGNPNASSTSTALKLSKESRTLGGGSLQKQKFFDGDLNMVAATTTTTASESTLITPSLVVPAQPVAPQQDVTVVPAAVLARQAKLEKLQKSGKAGPVSKKPRQFYPSVSNPQPVSTVPNKTPELKAAVIAGPKKVLPVLFSGINIEQETNEPELESTSHGAYQPLMIEQEESKFGNEHNLVQPALFTESEPVTTEQQPDVVSEILSKHELGRNNRKRHRFQEAQSAEVVNFSVDEFYEKNRLDNALEGNKTTNVVRAIGGGKHQLSSLLRSAQNNREGLEEMFLQNKRTKKEAGSKYGF